MTTLRLLSSLLAGAVIAMLLVIASAMLAMVLAISTQGRIEIPGLVLAEAGRGPDLGNVRLLPPGVLIWFFILTVAASGVTFLLSRKATRHEQTPTSSRS